MKTRTLFLFVPVVALATGYLAWDARFVAKAPDPVAVADAVNPLDPARTKPSRPSPIVASPPVEFETSEESGCEIVTHYMAKGDGTVLELLACERLNPREKHPYETYSSAALETLAYSDAKAAEVLGVRLRDKDLAKSMSLMIRSSALLGGDTAPIFQSFNMYPHSHEIDGAPIVKTIHTKFVLSAVADLLSGDTFYAGLWEDRIRAYSSDPEAEIALLYDQALRIIDEMRQIELEVTGSSTIGGQGDA